MSKQLKLPQLDSIYNQSVETFKMRNTSDNLLTLQLHVNLFY